jgi:DNA-binding NtrC family response regulator
MSCSPTPIVFVVDDDVSVREPLALMIQSAGWQPKSFASATELFALPQYSFHVEAELSITPFPLYLRHCASGVIAAV